MHPPNPSYQPPVVPTISQLLGSQWDYETEVEKAQSTFKQRECGLWVPEDSQFPELFVKVPDSWPSVKLAPWYDVHVGSDQFDEPLFIRHRDWMAETPYILSWNGGDIHENLTESKMGHTRKSNEEQIYDVLKLFAPVQHKLAFSLPGNHEDRSYKNAGVSNARRIADNLKLPFFPDYCFCTIQWRGNNFRLLAHHGAGGATTAGAQRNSARKELAWAKPDMLWTGHLHQTLTDTVFQTDYDQKTGRLYERDAVVLISPSYLNYFNGYAAKVRLGPGMRGLTVAELQEDGRIDVNVHARGRRL